MSESSEAILPMEARPDPYIGKVLAGRYRIIRVIGTGGMGAVYEAEHTLIGRRVAVKILYAQLASDAAVVKRFVNEARAAATIGHPHILECTDIGQADDGAPFLVLELLEGYDLEAEFEKSGPMPIGRLAFLLRQACDALTVAHEKGIIHRDIKPENIYLSVQKGKPDHVKVLDFGISKFNSMKQTGPGTMSGSAMGTPYYMSPEQFRDASGVDARADIYAMGVIMYQGLAGRLPFMADNLPGLALEIATGTPIPLEMIRPDLPPDLVALVNKTMARSAADRTQSMSELRDALLPFTHLDGPIEVRTIDPQNVAHMRTAAALDLASARRSQIRVKTDGSDDQTDAPRKSTSPVIAIGVALALVGGGAGVYAATRPRPVAPLASDASAPASPVVAVAAAAPAVLAPTPAAPMKYVITLRADAEGATALVRGQTVTLPYSAEIESSSTPEVIDVSAPDHTTMRYAFTIDRARNVFATLERGGGQRVATEAELALALTGVASSDTNTAERPSSAGTHASASAMSTSTVSTTASTTATATPPPTMSTEMSRPNVYVGPSNDVPEL